MSLQSAFPSYCSFTCIIVSSFGLVMGSTSNWGSFVVVSVGVVTVIVTGVEVVTVTVMVVSVIVMGVSSDVVVGSGVLKVVSDEVVVRSGVVGTDGDVNEDSTDVRVDFGVVNNVVDSNVVSVLFPVVVCSAVVSAVVDVT